MPRACVLIDVSSVNPVIVLYALVSCVRAVDASVLSRVWLPPALLDVETVDPMSPPLMVPPEALTSCPNIEYCASVDPTVTESAEARPGSHKSNPIADRTKGVNFIQIPLPI